MANQQSGLKVSFSRYVSRVPVGNPNRNWLGILRKKHGMQVHSVAEWDALIAAMKADKTPSVASYADLKRPAGR